MADGTVPQVRSMDMLGLGLELRAIRAELREADFVASTDTIDRYGEIVDQSSWRLDAYRRNPVVLFAHDSDELPIGQCTSLRIEGGALVCTIRFSQFGELSEDVWGQVQERTLRAVSVGFIPHTMQFELRDGREVLVLRDCELLEISVVPIPANPEALARAKARALGQTNEHATAAQENDMDQVSKSALESAQRELSEERAKNIEIESARAKLAAELAAERADLATERAALAEERAKLADVSAQLSAAQAELTVARKAVVEAEVASLIGKKLTPANATRFVELALKDRPTFDAIVADLPDLNLTERAIPEEGARARNVSDADADRRLAALPLKAG